MRRVGSFNVCAIATLLESESCLHGRDHAAAPTEVAAASLRSATAHIAHSMVLQRQLGIL